MIWKNFKHLVRRLEIISIFGDGIFKRTQCSNHRQCSLQSIVADDMQLHSFQSESRNKHGMEEMSDSFCQWKGER